MVKVDISSIRELRGGSIHFEGNQPIDVADSGLGFHLAQPVEIHGSVTNTGEGLLVQMKLSYTYQAVCARCLGDFTASQHVEVSEQFIAGEPLEDDSLFVFKGDSIDLDDCITQNVWLAFPIKLLCSEECRGLCPDCGQNLNLQKCQCVHESQNPQFEKLRTLLLEKGGGPNGKSEK